MAYLNTKERYGSLSIGLHWLMLLVLAGVYTCVELHDFFPKGSEMRSGLMTWHFSLGVTIFLLVCVRLVLRVIAPEPVIKPAITVWQKWSAKLMHWALYLLMIGMPIAGCLGRAAAGKVTYFFGIALPSLIGPNKELAETIFDWHETIGNLGYFLIGAHALAALFHHYVQRDNTLVRMLPKRG
ncbi:cytochrome b [Solimicrobium silvestre]|uniref:Cytochrome B561 n=1 Tax=Solimicrobium silvestre TaxID=2099400 RepID=A0A2S9GXU5_9BURK|nr:cytochrome b [Solimicrobium silvestre]PRC92545.1 Cytochrome B561 [Solimicrobium silvestre]